MPITFSLRSVAWLGVDPANLRNPSGSPAPRHSAPLVYAEPKLAGLGDDGDEIQYLVHGCPLVSMVAARKSEIDACTVHGLAGEVLYRAYSHTEDEFPIVLSEDHYDAVHAVYTTFTAERAAGRLR